MSAILNIDKSFLSSRWVFPEVNDDHIARMVSAHGLPEIVARLVSARAVAPAPDPAEARAARVRGVPAWGPRAGGRSWPPVRVPGQGHWPAPPPPRA